MNRNLVIIRAGLTGLQWDWLPTPKSNGSWDVHVSAYEEEVLERLPTCSRVTSSYEPGTKSQGLSACFDRLASRLYKYEYIYLPDDDLKMTPSDIDKVFRIARNYDLWICQPSLTADSFIAHDITRHRRGYTVRYTSFVEVMCPCFSRDAFYACKSLFRETLSSWGIDLVFPRLLGYPETKVAIIDAITVKHTRNPIDGVNTPLCLAAGISPVNEAIEVFERYSIPADKIWPYSNPDIIKTYGSTRKHSDVVMHIIKRAHEILRVIKKRVNASNSF